MVALPLLAAFGVQDALLKQLELTQQEMSTRQSLWESEKEALVVEREREATQRLLKEMTRIVFCDLRPANSSSNGGLPWHCGASLVPR